MAELIDVYTGHGERIGTMPKKEYYSGNRQDVPWIKCCTCFVIDDKEKKILFEKRGKRFLDPGKLDLCSGHIQSGETPTQGMVRELDEELNIKLDDSSNLRFLGELKIDYTKLKDETNQKILKCFVSIYALRMRDISKVQVDKKEAISMGWLSLDDAIGFISNNMTRIPYEDELIPEFDKVFSSLRNCMYPELNEKSYTLGEK